MNELLHKKKDIVITTHLNPDGDAIGSSLGLYNFLLQKKHIGEVQSNIWPKELIKQLKEQNINLL